MHEGPLDLLIGDAPLETVAAELRREHPGLEVLEIVDSAARTNQIRRPFTQGALLGKVEAQLQARGKLASANV